MKKVLLGLLVLVVIFMFQPVQAADSRNQVARVLSKPVVRGGIVYKQYCVICHGEKGEGNTEASKLYKKRNLVIRVKKKEYYERVIRKGSGFMPPWEHELSEEQIADVVSYLYVVPDAVRRGEVVYKTNCILCHGIKADGRGRASEMYNPPPANLTRSDKNDDYKTMIIKLGGKAMGRSSVMPSWTSQLSEQEITDVVRYLRTILRNH